MILKAIMGKKLGMTQVYDESGRALPVTVVEAGPCVVVQKKTMENDGYMALKIGFSDVDEKKVNKPDMGHFQKNKLKPKKYIKEFRMNDIQKYNIGDEVKVDIFKAGERVDVIGISKGKGYAGGIKRWNFKRGLMKHGSMYHRRPGSGGATAPARVFKGRKLPGHMGNERVTIQNLEIVKIDTDKNVMLIKGSVPGPKKSLLFIKNTTKANK